MVGVVLVLISVGLLIASPLCVAMLHISKRVGWFDDVGLEAHKRHDRAVVNTGGVAIFWAVVLPIVGVLGVVWIVPTNLWPKVIALHVPGVRGVTPIALLVVGAMTVMHTVGLFDDRRAMGPGPKLAAQLIVAAVLAIAADMRVLHMLDELGSIGYVASVLISIVWISIIINAFNFLDNMDGLAGGVALIIASLYLVVTLVGGQWFVAGLSAALVGALLGFLWFNLPSARLFMGDSGSLVIGTLLAIISVRTTYFDSHNDTRQIHALLMPVVMMAVPLYDFFSVTIIRLLQGQSPFRGDHNHFSHRLVKLGLSRRRAVGLIWICALTTAMSGVLLGSLDGNMAIIATIQAMAVLTILAVLESGVKRVS